VYPNRTGFVAVWVSLRRPPSDVELPDVGVQPLVDDRSVYRIRLRRYSASPPNAVSKDGFVNAFV